METSAAKRPRLEHNYCQDPEEIIQEQRRVIKNQKARIEQLEELLKELLTNSKSSGTETKIKNVLFPAPVPELPNEIWSEIISYLSTFDVLRNVALVSKRFHKLSEDPHVIRRIEVDSDQSWPEDKKEKYCDDFLAVLKRSVKLRNFSFGFSWDSFNDTSGEKILAALPSMNHQFLQELCLKGDGKEDFSKAAAFLVPLNASSLDISGLNENLLKYLEKCSSLKVLKFEFKPEVNEEFNKIDFNYLYELEEAIKCLKLKNLQEFHLIGVFMEEYSGSNDTLELFLDMIAENMPKLQRLCLTCEDEDTNGWNEMCQAFASRKNIRLEISSVVNNITEWSCVEFTRRKNVPIKETKVFCPKLASSNILKICNIKIFH